MPDFPLRLALMANVVFSALSGLLMVTGPADVAAMLGGASALVVQAAGGGLLAFAACVARVAARRSMNPAEVGLIIGADLAWVVLSCVGLLAFGRALPAAGVGAVAGAAVMVLLLAVAQGVTLMRAFATGRGGYRYCVVVEARVDARALWLQVADLGGIARHAPNLRASRLEAGSASPVAACRYCEDTAGRGWREDCQLRPDTMSVLIAFRADDAGFPFPVSRMSGRWTVEPSGTDARATIEWEFEPRSPMAAPLLLGMLAWQANAAMPRIVGSMCRAAGVDGSPVGRRAARRIAVAC